MNKGFSLIEALVVIGISACVFSIALAHCRGPGENQITSSSCYKNCLKEKETPEYIQSFFHKKQYCEEICK